MLIINVESHGIKISDNLALLTDGLLSFAFMELWILNNG